MLLDQLCYNLSEHQVRQNSFPRSSRWTGTHQLATQVVAYEPTERNGQTLIFRNSCCCMKSKGVERCRVCRASATKLLKLLKVCVTRKSTGSIRR